MRVGKRGDAGQTGGGYLATQGAVSFADVNPEDGEDRQQQRGKSNPIFTKSCLLPFIPFRDLTWSGIPFWFIGAIPSLFFLEKILKLLFFPSTNPLTDVRQSHYPFFIPFPFFTSIPLAFGIISNNKSLSLALRVENFCPGLFASTFSSLHPPCPIVWLVNYSVRPLQFQSVSSDSSSAAIRMHARHPNCNFIFIFEMRARIFHVAGGGGGGGGPSFQWQGWKRLRYRAWRVKWRCCGRRRIDWGLLLLPLILYFYHTYLMLRGSASLTRSVYYKLPVIFLFIAIYGGVRISIRDRNVIGVVLKEERPPAGGRKRYLFRQCIHGKNKI